MYNTSDSSLFDSPIVMEVNANNYDFYKRLFTNILDVSHSPHSTRKFHSWFQNLIPKNETKKRVNSLNCAVYALITFVSQMERNNLLNEKINNESILTLLKELKKHCENDFVKALNEQLNKIKDTNKDLNNYLKVAFSSSIPS